MDETPTPDALPGLKFLKTLVTILTGTMIAGLVAVIWLLVIRLPAAIPPQLALPASITLPAGTTPLAFTATPDWYAVVTGQDTILIFDAKTGAQRQTIAITP